MSSASTAATKKKSKSEKLELSALGERFNLQVPSLEGDKPTIAFGGDSGYRNLALALGICWEPLPEFDASWTEGDLVNPELAKKYDDGQLANRRPEPVHILAVSHIDLTPAQVFDSDVNLTVFQSPLLKEFTKGIDKKFNDRLDQLREEFTAPSSPFMASTVDKVTQRLTGLKLFHRLDFALEYTSEYDSEHNLSRQLAKAVLHPSMRWLWLFPGEMNMENQPDVIKFADKKKWKTKAERAKEKEKDGPVDENKPKPVTPIVWYMAGFMKGIMMFFDFILFGRPRTCRLLASKYGNLDKDLATITHKLHTTASDVYTLRKLRSVEAVKIFLRATNQMELFYWITTHLRHQGLAEGDRDVSDAVALMLERFCSGTRDKPYTNPERERIAEFREKRQQELEDWSTHGGRPDVKVDLFNAERFEGDGCDYAVDDYLKRERVRLKRELKPIRQRKGKAEDEEQAAEDELFEKGQRALVKEGAKAVAAKRTTNLDSFFFSRSKTKQEAEERKQPPVKPSALQKEVSKEDQAWLEDLLFDVEKEEKTAPPPLLQPISLEDQDFNSLLQRKRAENSSTKTSGSKKQQQKTVKVDLKRLTTPPRLSPSGSEVIVLDEEDDIVDSDDEEDQRSKPKKKPSPKSKKGKAPPPATRKRKHRTVEPRDDADEDTKQPAAKRAKRSIWDDDFDEILSDSDDDGPAGFSTKSLTRGSGFTTPFDLYKTSGPTSRPSRSSGASAAKSSSRRDAHFGGVVPGAATVSERMGIWQ